MMLQADLEKLMPHRGAMLFLQHLTFCSPELIQGDCTVQESNPFLKSNGKVSDGFHVELLAQLAAAAQGFEARKIQNRAAIGYLVGIKNFKISADCSAGALFHLELRPILHFGQTVVFAGEVRNDGTLVAAGELRVHVMPDSIEPDSITITPTRDPGSFEKILQRNFSLLENQASAIFAEVSLPGEIPGLEGHFPGHPIVPAAFLLDLCFWTLKECGLPQMSEIRFAKFVAKVLPGQKLTLRLKRMEQLLNVQIYANTVEAVRLEIALRAS
jgi:predicted hotdog family 3-hydroxylacyl-ACP dehydratase